MSRGYGATPAEIGAAAKVCLYAETLTGDQKQPKARVAVSSCPCLLLPTAIARGLIDFTPLVMCLLVCQVCDWCLVVATHTCVEGNQQLLQTALFTELTGRNVASAQASAMQEDGSVYEPPWPVDGRKHKLPRNFHVNCHLS